MKILDRYILVSYIQRLLSVFVILMLIFIIQTIWLFIDEFAGKGIDIGTRIFQSFKFLNVNTVVPCCCITPFYAKFAAMSF